MHWIYKPDLQQGNKTLDEHSSKHLIKVLRLKKGDTIYLFDGKGNGASAKIIDPNQKKCNISIQAPNYRDTERNYYLHIAIAPTKNINRFEWFVEKATEMGIDEITPMICDNSERKDIKTNRLDRILIAAMQQSQKHHKPILNEKSSFNKLIETNYQGNKYIAHCYNANKMKLSKSTSNEKAIVLIGPEGDFSKDEIMLATAHGYQAISLGNTRLRTETAGIVVCAHFCLNQ
jgi:16S rRNA (uracil1498-N3)-methyltransferase